MYGRARFQSTLPLRGATCRDLTYQPANNISIHAPLTGSDFGNPAAERAAIDFNPRSPYGERHPNFKDADFQAKFQSTLPLRGATRPAWTRRTRNWISIHAPLTGSDEVGVQVVAKGRISIHAPLTGSDGSSSFRRRPGPISIHAPLTGSDAFTASWVFSQLAFQSTLPLRGATGGSSGPGRNCPYFNPRSPYGERRSSFGLRTRRSYFNPRSPYGERPSTTPPNGSFSKFQSTLPLRGATRRKDCRCCTPQYFNPRSPYGERPPDAPTPETAEEFQSTLPLRGATSRSRRSSALSTNFNPRSPYGERLAVIASVIKCNRFQSTLPLRGATPCPSDWRSCHRYFNPRSPYGERRSPQL